MSVEYNDQQPPVVEQVASTILTVAGAFLIEADAYADETGVAPTAAEMGGPSPKPFVVMDQNVLTCSPAAWTKVS